MTCKLTKEFEAKTPQSVEEFIDQINKARQEMDMPLISKKKNTIDYRLAAETFQRKYAVLPDKEANYGLLSEM